MKPFRGKRMGPQAPSRNSTSGPFVSSPFGSWRPGAAGAGVRGRIFRGGKSRPVRCQSEARREGSRASARCLARRRVGLAPDRGTPAAAGALAPSARCDWEGLFSVPSDRGWARDRGQPPPLLRVCGCSVGSLSDPS